MFHDASKYPISLPSEGRGQGFESLRVRQFISLILKTNFIGSHRVVRLIVSALRLPGPVVGRLVYRDVVRKKVGGWRLIQRAAVRRCD